MEVRSVGNVLATLTALQREFRPWAMWRNGRGEWTATRARPGEARLVWVLTQTPEELVTRMREEDER